MIRGFDRLKRVAAKAWAAWLIVLGAVGAFASLFPLAEITVPASAVVFISYILMLSALLNWELLKDPPAPAVKYVRKPDDSVERALVIAEASAYLAHGMQVSLFVLDGEAEIEIAQGFVQTINDRGLPQVMLTAHLPSFTTFDRLVYSNAPVDLKKLSIKPAVRRLVEGTDA